MTTVVATGIGSTVSAGQSIGGSQTIAGNCTVGQNIAISGTATIQNNRILTIKDLANAASNVATTVVVNNYLTVNVGVFYTIANVGDTQYILTTNPVGITANSFVSVSRNGLLEVPTLHYTVSGNVLTFKNSSQAGDLIYATWNY